MASTPVGVGFGPTVGLDRVGPREQVPRGPVRIGEMRGRDVQQTPESIARDNRRVVVGFKANLALKYGAGIADKAFPQADALHRASAPLTRGARDTAVRAGQGAGGAGRADAARQHHQRDAVQGDRRRDPQHLHGRQLQVAAQGARLLPARRRAESGRTVGRAEAGADRGAAAEGAELPRPSKETELLRKGGDAGDVARIEARMVGTRTLLEGLGDKSRELYGRLTGHDMSTARFVPENEVGVDAGFASGAMSSVDKIRYQDGTEGVFKAERRDGPMPHDAARNTGIPDRLADANMSGRAVATSKLDQALGLNLVPRTEFAVHGVRAGCVQEFARGGTLFARVP